MEQQIRRYAGKGLPQKDPFVSATAEDIERWMEGGAGKEKQNRSRECETRFKDNAAAASPLPALTTMTVGPPFFP